MIVLARYHQKSEIG